MTQVE